MPIRIQCEKCGSVMNIREDYAGTERRCPKCRAKFKVPAVSTAVDDGTLAAEVADEPQEHEAEDFDAIAFLTGGKAKGKPEEKPAPPKQDFDPLDVLGGATGAAAQKKSSGSAKSSPKTPAQPASATPPAAEEGFDPLAVLGAGPAKNAPSAAASEGTSPASPASPPNEPGQSEPYKPRRPSWAKPLSDETPAKEPATEAPAAETPAAEAPAEPEPYKPRRPSWAKPSPEEKPAEGEPKNAPAAAPDKPAEAEPYKPRRPAWARSAPGEQPTPAAAVTATAVAEDASPAAKAAAAAMGGVVQASGPPPEAPPEPRQPLFDRAAIVAGFKRRLVLIAATIPTAAALFGLSWLIFKPGGVRVPSPLIPVSGRVTLDGKPIEGARVIFTERSMTARSAEGVTDADGRYSLHYFQGALGAPPGRYLVRVEQVNARGQDIIPPAFGAATKQEKLVSADGKEIDVTIETPPLVVQPPRPNRKPPTR